MMNVIPIDSTIYFIQAVKKASEEESESNKGVKFDYKVTFNKFEFESGEISKFKEVDSIDLELDHMLLGIQPFVPQNKAFDLNNIIVKVIMYNEEKGSLDNSLRRLLDDKVKLSPLKTSLIEAGDNTGKVPFERRANFDTLMMLDMSVESNHQTFNLLVKNRVADSKADDNKNYLVSSRQDSFEVHEQNHSNLQALAKVPFERRANFDTFEVKVGSDQGSYL
jgi:hypothetical protein